MMHMYDARRWLLVTALAAAIGSYGCSGNDCKDGATAMNGMCMPVCPSTKCGDKVCTLYFWPDGSYDKDLRCESHKTCAADCSNADMNLAQAIMMFLSMAESKSSLPNPADNQTGSATCSAGGQVALSGSRWCRDIMGGKTCLNDVTFTFADCAFTIDYYPGRPKLTFSSGSIRSTSSYLQPNPSGAGTTQFSGQVALSGTLYVGRSPVATVETLPQTNCAMDFNHVYTGTTGTFTGTMCGRAIVDPVYMPDDTSSSP